MLIVCPATVKKNWQREWNLWNTTEDLKDPVIIQGRGKTIPDKGVVIINYDVLKHYKEQLDKVDWDLIIGDEVHLVKNRSTARATALVGNYKKKVEAIKARKRVFMTGTPIENRPNELWPLLSVLDSGEGGIARQFKRFHKSDGYAWRFDPTKSNELHEKLRARVMIRRLERDVLDLPQLNQKIVVLEPDAKAQRAIHNDLVAAASYAQYLADLAEKEKEFAEQASKIDVEKEGGEKELKELEKRFETSVAVLRASESIPFEEIAKIRHNTAVAKLPQFVDYMNEVLEQKDKIIVFAHHKDVIDGIEQSLKTDGIKSVTVDGSTSMDARQRYIDAFQTDPNVRVFIGNIRAAGVGITLTAANDVLFAEQDWTPGSMDQAIKRAHRIGQKGRVFVHNVVFDGTLDAEMAHIIEEKRRTIKNVLDAGKKTREQIEQEIEKVESVAPVVESDENKKRQARSYKEKFNDKLREVRQDKKNKNLPHLELSEDHEEQKKQIDALHEGIRHVKKSGMFGMYDSDFGTSLANADRLSPNQAVYAYGMLHKYQNHAPGHYARAHGKEIEQAKPESEQKKPSGEQTRPGSEQPKEKEEKRNLSDDLEARKGQVMAIQEGLGMLAAMDSDRATHRNDMGFNKLHGDIGRHLASHPDLHLDEHRGKAEEAFKLVRFYRRQIPGEILRRAGIEPKLDVEEVRKPDMQKEPIKESEKPQVERPMEQSRKQVYVPGTIKPSQSHGMLSIQDLLNARQGGELKKAISDSEKRMRKAIFDSLNAGVVGNQMGLFDLLKSDSNAAIEGWAAKMRREGGEHPFRWCVEKTKAFASDPEAFCASVHQRAFGKTPSERAAEKD